MPSGSPHSAKLAERSISGNMKEKDLEGFRQWPWKIGEI